MSVILKPHKILKTGQTENRFYLADCLDVFKQLEPHSVDVIVTSPPYNIGIQYSRYQDALSPAEYLEWTDTWVAAATRVLKPEGSLFLNVGAKPSDPWTALDVVAGGAAAPASCRTSFTGSSRSPSTGRRPAPRAGLTRDLAVGHYKPINSDRFLNDCHEFIFHLTPHGATSLDRLALGVPYQDQSNIARWRGGSGGVRCRGNTWFIPYETIQHRDRDRPHPATFPTRLPEQCLRLHGLERIRGGDGSVHRPGQHGCRLRAPRRELHRIGSRRDVSGRGDRRVDVATSGRTAGRAGQRDGEDGGRRTPARPTALLRRRRRASAAA